MTSDEVLLQDNALKRVHCNCYGKRYSAVAQSGGGATSPPIGPKRMQNSTFLGLLRPIFVPKMKTELPQRNWGAEVVKDLPLLVEFFCSGAPSKVGEDLFFFEIT